MASLYELPDRTHNRFDDDPELSYTIPASLYVDKEVLDSEKVAIFYRQWMCVTHVGKLSEPGAYATADILGQNVFVIRSKDGVLRAFYNVCQHRGHELLHGSGQVKNVITCPYHAWAYSDDGKLAAARHCEGVKAFDKEDFGLRAIRVEVFCGFVFVNLDPDAVPMADHFPGLENMVRQFCPDVDALQQAKTVEFDIKGNWKNVGDNLLECYHCAPSHRAFVDLVDMQSYVVETQQNWSVQYGRCRPSSAAYDFSDSEEPQSFSTIFVWPCMAFVTFPGAPGMAIFSFPPMEPELTYQEFTYYSRDGGMTETETAVLTYFNDVLGPEDVDLVESVQRGLKSRGYHQGRFVIDAERSHTSEHAVHHFHALVMSSLAESQQSFEGRSATGLTAPVG